MRKLLLPLLAIGGVVLIAVAIAVDNQPAPPAAAIATPKAPFAAWVGGAGMLEASSGNIAVGTAVSGIVTATFVKWGDQVRTGDALFKIDDRDVQAQLLSARAAIKEAEVKLQQSDGQLRLVESVPDRRAVSTEEFDNRRAAVALAQAVLASARARLAQFALEIDRRTVRALAPGKILQINIRPGEFAQSGVLARPLVLLGNDERLALRVDVDEFDAARIKPGAAAVAFVRGDPQRAVRLTFERIEPYVAPKAALTGSATERVDTRVLQVIYSVARAGLPVYIGQQMDVYIEAPAARTAP